MGALPVMIWFSGARPTLAGIDATGAGSLQAHLGMVADAVGDDWLRLRMPVDARTRQPFGRLHGGASLALAETAGSVAANFCVDPQAFVAVGLEINANHVRAARDGWVFATARPEALGRTTQVWSIRIEDEAGRLVCLSRFTVAVIPRDRA